MKYNIKARLAPIAFLFTLAHARSVSNNHPRAAEGLSVNPADIANKEFDYVIVGSGAGGLPLAARLTEDPSITVALIEAGGDGETVGTNVMQRILIPAMTYFDGIVSPGSEYDWGYTVNSRADVWGPLPRGRILGGSTAVNALYNIRASKLEHDAWATLNPGATQDWSWDGLFPYMKKAEHFTPPSAANASFSHITTDPSFHGQDGPIHSSTPFYQYDQLQHWVPTLGNLGISTRDPQGGEGWGAYLTPLSIDPATETRSYAKTGYWDPNAARPNFHVLLKHQATKILFDTSSTKPRATGIQFSPSDAPTDGSARPSYTVTAKKEVLLAGGVIGSPHLMLLSGVGPRRQLEGLNIPVILDLPGVGAHLQDHVQVRTAFRTSVDVTGDRIIQSEDFKNEQLALYQSGAFGSSLYSAPNNAVAYLGLKDVLAVEQLHDTGERPADGGAALAAAYVKDCQDSLTAYLDQYPDLDPTVRAGYELTYRNSLDHVINSDAGAIEFMLNNVGTFNPTDKTIAIQVGLQHPFSRGSVVINTTDPFVQPVIKYNYLNHDADKRLLRAGVKFARQTAATEPLSSILLGEIQPGPDTATNEQIDTYMDGNANTQYHPAGTAAQLPLDKGGVVDSELKVYGIDSLRVIDASIIPVGISAHLMWPTYAIGEKGAAILLNTDGSKVGNPSGTDSAPTQSTPTPTNRPGAGIALQVEHKLSLLIILSTVAYFCI